MSSVSLEDGAGLKKGFIMLLDQELGIRSEQNEPHREEFADLCGKWSKEEKSGFDKAIADFEEIDPAD